MEPNLVINMELPFHLHHVPNHTVLNEIVLRSGKPEAIKKGMEFAPYGAICITCGEFSGSVSIPSSNAASTAKASPIAV
jgi:hypothetical protein